MEKIQEFYTKYKSYVIIGAVAVIGVLLYRKFKK